MEGILTEIERAIAGGLFYAAINMSLTLPDICGALESQDGKTSGLKYKAWYAAHICDNTPWLTAEDCYSLRCGVLHEGNFGHGNMQYCRVIFTLPDGRNNLLINNIVNKAYLTDAVDFCTGMVAAVRQWYATAKNTTTVQANISKIFEFRAQGLAPYVVGVPVIA